MSTVSPPGRVREPKVLPPYPVRRAISTLATSPSLMAQIIPSLLPSPPRWLAVVAYLLLLVNITDFPGLWHIRLLRPLLLRMLRARAATALLIGVRGGGDVTNLKTGRQISYQVLPLGKDIFEEKLYRQQRAWPADCDYLLHISNSSYPKILDHSRAALYFGHFYRFFSEGGMMLLGGNNFHFHKEIPLMTKFEVQVGVASWDDKWIYFIAKFTSPTDPASPLPTEPIPSSTPGSTARSPGLSLSRSASNLRSLLSDISKPEHEARAAAKKESSSQGPPNNSHTVAAAQGTAAGQPADSYFPSGARAKPAKPTVYCTSVSRYCFKYGRKTIPPWFVIATSGFGTWVSTRTNWDKAEEVRAQCASNGAAKVTKDKSEGSTRKRVKPWEAMLDSFDPRLGKERDTSGASQARAKVTSWSEPDFWSLSEWEPRRRQGMALVEQLGGLPPSDAAAVS